MLREITSQANQLIKHLVKLRLNRSYRYDHHSVIIEGKKIIYDLAKTHVFKTVLTSDETLLPPALKSEDVFLVSHEVMVKLSGHEAPQGLIAEMAMPKSASLKGCKKIIVLDGVADPGNLGALLRSAVALGWHGAFIIDGSCDPYNDKALSAARGATFTFPIATGTWDDLKIVMEMESLSGVMADLHGKPLSDCHPKGGIALVFGNEGQGVSREAKELCQAVTIPMPGEMESLNVAVAGGIMMYCLNRDRP
jgi:TrmH family RNA methyltransferase